MSVDYGIYTTKGKRMLLAIRAMVNGRKAVTPCTMVRFILLVNVRDFLQKVFLIICCSAVARSIAVVKIVFSWQAC